MTEIATRQEGAVSTFAPTPSEAVAAALEQWVGGMAASVRGAEYIVDTPMCPDAFWPLPAGVRSKTPKQMLPNEDRDSYLARRQIAAYTLGGVVRYGLQLGLPPEVAVQGIFTVGGRMSMYAEQMVALVKSRGHGHRIVERGRERAIVEVRRAGDQEWRRFEFTFEDAVDAGYVPKQGPNKDPGTWPDGKPKQGGGNEKYLLDPAAMLYARCSSIACRTEFPDVLRGLVTYEEVQDEQRVSVTVEAEVETQPAARVTAAEILGRAQPAPALPVMPVAERAEPPAASPEPPQAVADRPEPIDDRQWRDIGTAFVKLAVTGPGQQEKRLAVLSELAGRAITGRNDLTFDEGVVILDTLKANGRQVVFEILNPRAAHEPATGEQTAASPIAQAMTNGAEPQPGEYDPTASDSWPMDNDEAAQGYAP